MVDLDVELVFDEEGEERMKYTDVINLHSINATATLLYQKAK